MSKICYVCGIEQENNCYTKKTGAKDNLNSTCKSCVKIRKVKKASDLLMGKYSDKTTVEYRYNKFLNDSVSVHGDKYDYSNVVYINALSKVTIRCIKHDFCFDQTPNCHTSGKGCQYCANEIISAKLTSTTQDWIDKAISVHGDKYDYSYVDYQGDACEVCIKCKTCNSKYMQIAGNHLQGNGCKSCAGYGFKDNKNSYLYIMRDNDLVKVGITNRNVEERARQINRSGMNFEVIFTLENEGLFNRKLEKYAKTYLKSLYKNPTFIFDGYTESFLDVDVENLINILKERNGNRPNNTDR